MIRAILALFLFANVAWSACTKVNTPTDYAIVTNGTRANLKANFSEIQTRVNPCMDSVDEVRGRLSGYATSLTVTSLENLRLRIDGDGSTTGMFLVETSNGDSLFRVKEDSSAKFFGNLTVAGSISGTGVTTYPSLSASLPLALNSSKEVINAAVTGTGTTMVLSVSPSITGTLAAANGTYSGTLGVTGVGTFTAAPVFSSVTASQILSVNGSKALTSVGTTGTGSVMLAASPTTTGTLAADNGTFSGTLGVTGAFTNTALAGTGTRVTTSTATGVQGNATSIDGANTWNGVQTFVANPMVTYSNPGATTKLTVNNTSNTASSEAQIVIQVEGAAALDPNIRWNVNGVTSWIAGVDNSVSGDPFVIAATGSLGSGNVMSITTAGAVSLPGSLAVTGATTATGGLTLGASFVDKTTSLTSNTTLSTAHSTVFVDATSGAVTLTLPAASGNAGLTYSIYKVDASTNTLTVDGNASETVGGATTKVLGGNTSNSRIVIICDGTNWQIRDLYDEGTFTCTATGMTTSPTGTANYSVVGDFVSMTLPSNYATSNSTSFTYTGLPTHLRADISGVHSAIGTALDNGASVLSDAYFTNSGTIQFAKANSVAWTNSGTKGISRSWVGYSRK